MLPKPRITIPENKPNFDGKRRVREEANFYCPEIVQILKNAGLKYTWKKLPKNTSEKEFNNLSIVFIKRSKTHPYGHFLCKYNNLWMDPWINLPDISST